MSQTGIFRAVESDTKSPMSINTPIFIFGILERCGTNYLTDLLQMHPDCIFRKPIMEDNLLRYANLLVQYTQSLLTYWQSHRWGVPDEEEARLAKSLGDGLISFLEWDRTEKRIVTKTPNVHHIHLFSKFFPHAAMIILVRDGRSVAESSFHTFGYPYEQTARTWARNARQILHFIDSTRNGSRQQYLFVRYEDLLNNLTSELVRIFDFVGLDPHTYDFESARNCPVRGSSQLKKEQNGIHWDPVANLPNFTPLERFKHWHSRDHRRFNWLARHELSAFGYQPEQSSPLTLAGQLEQRILDTCWWVKTTIHATGSIVFRSLMSVTRSIKRLLHRSP